MSRDPVTVFRKTELGLDELKSRRHGLNPRARQLLILVDGRRSVEELGRLLPLELLDPYLTLLDEGGFVEALSPVLPAAGAPLDPEEFPRVRQQLARALLDAAGPSGSEFAIRVERCASLDEMHDLLPAAVQLVEAIRGRAASRSFAARVGLRGHDLDTLDDGLHAPNA